MFARNKHNKTAYERDDIMNHLGEISSSERAIKVIITRSQPTKKRVVHIDKNPNKRNVRVAVTNCQRRRWSANFWFDSVQKWSLSGSVKSSYEVLSDANAKSGLFAFDSIEGSSVAWLLKEIIILPQPASNYWYRWQCDRCKSGDLFSSQAIAFLPYWDYSAIADFRNLGRLKQRS